MKCSAEGLCELLLLTLIDTVALTAGFSSSDPASPKPNTFARTTTLVTSREHFYTLDTGVKARNGNLDTFKFKNDASARRTLFLDERYSDYGVFSGYPQSNGTAVVSSFSSFFSAK